MFWLQVGLNFIPLVTFIIGILLFIVSIEMGTVVGPFTALLLDTSRLFGVVLVDVQVGTILFQMYRLLTVVTIYTSGLTQALPDAILRTWTDHQSPFPHLLSIEAFPRLCGVSSGIGIR